MYDQFVNDFMVKISNKLPDDYLRLVYQELNIYVNEFDIEKKCTDVVVYDGYLPECYATYFVTRKIEGMSEKTLQLYNMYLRDFFFELNKPIKEITTNDIRVYLYTTQKNRNISNRTLDSRRACIHAFLEWATNEQYIDRNPCRNIKPVKYERKERVPLTAIELEQVRNACVTVREHAMIEFFYSTGCRVTEMENMNITDIDFNKKEVTLFGKGNKHRTSYINARAELALKAYLQSRDDDGEALFVSERKPHTRLMKPAIEKIVREIGKRADIERRLFPHLIRHTTASDGLNRGMSITEVQKILGHVNINTTLVYARISESQTKADHVKCII